MNCPTCATPNWDQARFCKSCGGRFEAAVATAPPQAQAWPPPQGVAPPHAQGWPAQPPHAQAWPAQQPGGHAWPAQQPGGPPPEAWAPPQQGWAAPSQRWAPQGQPWGPPQQAWGRAPGTGPLDWKAVGIGAASLAVSIVTTYHVFVKQQAVQALQSGQQMSMLPILLLFLSLGGLGGAVAVHYSPTRSAYEGGLAGLLGIWAALLVLSVAPPTVPTAYGAVSLFNLTFGWFLIDSLIFPAAAYGGGWYYAETLRKKGK